jgi:transposase
MKQAVRKEELLKEYLRGGTSIRKLAEKYGIGVSTVQRWLMSAKREKNKKAFLDAGKLPKPTEGMSEDVRQLQEELYNAQLKINLLEAMIDISDEQFGTDIRKKSGTRQS